MAYPILRHTLLPLIRRRFEVKGEENIPTQTPYLIAANHASYLDGIMLGVILALARNQRAFYLAHDKYAKIFTRYLSEHWFGMIAVPTHNKAKVLERAMLKLKAGKIITIFPEGTRNPHSNQLLRGKTGLARLALATGLPVLPVGVIAPPTATFGEAFRVFADNTLSLGLIFGQPIQFPVQAPATFTHEQLDQVTRQVMTAIGVLCHKLYQY